MQANRAIEAQVGAGRGVWTGLAPLLPLLVGATLTVAATALARVVATPQGFFVWQWVDVVVWVVGLALTALVYGIVLARALRHARVWQERGLTPAANAAYWALALTALVTLAPLLLALLLPQHPAPPRAP